MFSPVYCLIDLKFEVIKVVYEGRRSLARHEYPQGGQQQFFIIVFFQYSLSDVDIRH